MADGSNGYPGSASYATSDPENQSTAEHTNPSSTTSPPRWGALYAPGTYPTPELLPYPTGRYRVLDQVSSFTSETIQAALNQLGEYGTIYLPQRSRWAVSSVITLSSHQELATWGYPTDEASMALLKAESVCKPRILTSIGSIGVRIRNLRIDGRRERFGYDEKCEGMVILGGAGADSQAIDHCVLMHPRQNVCCHVYRGGQSIRITNNTIGPAGYPKVGSDDISSDGISIDGISSDGISSGASNSLIAGNLIVDATSSAINLYAARGTLVTSNTIITQTRAGVAGVHLSFYKPNSGNHEWARVVHNTVRLKGAFLKVGIAQGDQVLWERTPRVPERVVHGASVRFNLIESNPVDGESAGAIGFGYAVSMVENWTCTDNASAPGVVYSGSFPPTTTDGDQAPQNAQPTPFIRLTSSPNSTFQDEFIEGKVTGLASITPA